VIAVASTARGTAAPLQQSDMDHRLVLVEQWLKAVMRHEPGTTDEAAALVGSWSNAEMRALWTDSNVVVQMMRNPRLLTFTMQGQRAQPIRYTREHLRRLKAFGCAAAGRVGDLICADVAGRLDADLVRLGVLSKAANFHGDEDNYILRRGALLHADIAMLIVPSAEPVGSGALVGPRRVRMQISDGREIDLTQVAVHWEIARMLLDYVRPAGGPKPAPARDEMVRTWYRATALWMQSRENHDTLHLDRAREIFPTDADILFLSGCQHETYAAPPIQSVLRSAPTGLVFDVGSEKRELRQAEDFFRRSVAANPSMAEARLRLGRALFLLARYSEAASELREALAATDEQLLRYYGTLFLGAAEEAQGHFDDARGAYADAEMLYPAAQSPRIALSALARRRGDRATALRELQGLFELSPSEPERDDPWWSYHVAQARNVDDVLEELWKPFRKNTE
jgi:tetratricopeptide (TPR) repeat protein